jgi:hypothetical protein
MKTLAFLAALALTGGTAFAQDSVKGEYESKLNSIKVTLDFTNAPLDSVFRMELSPASMYLVQAIPASMLKWCGETRSSFRHLSGGSPAKRPRASKV